MKALAIWTLVWMIILVLVWAVSFLYLCYRIEKTKRELENKIEKHYEVR